MNISRRCCTLLFLLLLSHQILPVISQSEKLQQKTTNEDKPSTFKIVSNTLSLLKNAHKNSVEKIKTIIHDFRLQFTSPKPDEEAMKKRVETGKENVEETAKPAAETVEKTAKPAAETVEKTAKPAAETVQKSAEKVEGDASDKKESRDEL
ncbi:uncharacterized protein LOC120159675 [Hibiscus syriacus]|uniref:uncharacterized protein LOC120159675 n=1 Tax=Hibiscus syriacus TaxID=106335 RepID=UPI0019229A40|nr:uncharacterized protein LOC120159675 [Hibiscus syriacus]